MISLNLVLAILAVVAVAALGWMVYDLASKQRVSFNYFMGLQRKLGFKKFMALLAGLAAVVAVVMCIVGKLLGLIALGLVVYGLYAWHKKVASYIATIEAGLKRAVSGQG